MPNTRPFHRYKQLESMDCGPTCLRMVAKYYGRTISLDFLKKRAQYGKDGVSLLGLASAAESIGLKAIGCRMTFDELMTEAQLPSILHWNQRHFVVLSPESDHRILVIADPAKGLVRLGKEQFLKHWLSGGAEGEVAGKGIALLLEKTAAFDIGDKFRTFL